tara:strand:+ start:2394 stop:3386 length:993 start_codon:yes stop_codon:yes gene_type:complete
MKITESVLREKISRILKEQRKLGRSLEAFIDAFLLTDKYNFQDLGYFGEKIAEVWFKEKHTNLNVSNLNKIKTQNFSFGDIIVGDLSNLGESKIYSVKATSANTVPMSNSNVKLSSINEMLIRTGKAGLGDELRQQKIVENQIPITLGLISIRHRPDIRRRSALIEVKEYSSKFLVVKKESQSARAAADDDKQTYWLQDARPQLERSKLQFKLIRQPGAEVKELTGYIKTEDAAKKFFGPQRDENTKNFLLDRSKEFEEKRIFNYKKARKARTELFAAFKEELSSLSNENLVSIVKQAKAFAEENANLSESFSKELVRTCLGLLVERKRP